MKALEKAAKDRLDTKLGDGSPTPVEAASAADNNQKSELTLEPISTPAPETVVPPAAAPAPAPAQRPRAPPARNSAAPAAAPAASPEPAEAAAVIRAGQRTARSGVFARLSEHPLVVFGVLTALFVIGYGAYVYTELNPGAFVRQAPRTAPSAPIAQARAPTSAPVAGTIIATPAAGTPPPPTPLVSLLPPLHESAAGREPPAPQATVVVAAPARKSAATAAPAPAAVGPAPISTPPPPRDTIKVTSGNAALTVNPLLADAYRALAEGRLEPAQQLYGQLLNSDPGNVEGLLGMASIATQRGDRDSATRHYVRILELDPRNTLAQAGLIGVVGRADPVSAETRVKQLIARDPSSAYLHFTLGNTYVDQNRWPDAQQSYFQAHHLQPDNPDYAYNLAVALEHIGQARPALDYYRRAVQLAASKGRANFSTAAAQERVSKLEKVVQ